MAAVAGVVLCRLSRLPPILGYLAVGILIGPRAIAVLGGDSAGVSHLAEFGIVFLMFVIGLEFNLPKLQSMKKLVFGLGLSQVVLTILAALGGNALLAWGFALAGKHGMGLGWQSAIALGSALAMSSTAIVVKLIADRLELESEHGRRVMGVLLFQDLAVVPLLVLIPALGSSPEALAGALAIALVKAGALVTVLLVGGKWVMRWWLTLVVRRKSEELFILNLLLVTLGLAWLTEMAGLVARARRLHCRHAGRRDRYKHQVETDIRPFHDVLLGLFFITIGMKLDAGAVLAHWPAGAGVLTVAPVLFKFVLVTRWRGAVRRGAGVALRTGLYLAQAGEFGFVLARARDRARSLSPELQSPVLASMVLSMLATPFIIMYSNRIVMRLSRERLVAAVGRDDDASPSARSTPRRTSSSAATAAAARTWRGCSTPRRFPTSRSTSTPTACARPRPPARRVVFGDAARLQSLMAAGWSAASAVVVSYQRHAVGAADPAPRAASMRRTCR